MHICLKTYNNAWFGMHSSLVDIIVFALTKALLMCSKLIIPPISEIHQYFLMHGNLFKWSTQESSTLTKVGF